MEPFEIQKGPAAGVKLSLTDLQNMRACALIHGLWTNCQCAVDQSGGEQECISNAGYYFEQRGMLPVRPRFRRPGVYAFMQLVCKKSSSMMQSFFNAMICSFSALSSSCMQYYTQFFIQV
jgi:hypothetical protein